ncbi:hypothetical protein ACVBKF_11205, partial [Shewanella sp. 0m-11]
MKSISKHTKLNMLAIAIASVFSTNAMSATEPEALAAAIAKQEAELAGLKTQLLQLAELQKVSTEQAAATQQQVLQTAKATDTVSNWDKFSFKSYGSVIYTSDEYYDNVQDTSPERRSRFDLERIVTEFGYQFNDEWDMEVEIEYEHGGTGTALEYDGFDEFGEFEAEVEAGGEVMIEKAEIRYRPSDAFGVKFGNIHLPVGVGSMLHKPSQYLTVQRHKSEAAMLPTVWNENGIGIFGEMANFRYQAQVVSGLNSEYFRTYDWVASGHQKRFEHVNGDDLAYVVRLDYGNFKTGSAIGASYYYGNTSGNRHKTNKLSADGTVEILSIAGAFVEGPWILRGQYLYGTLSDSDAITQANKTTPGLKPGNFAQLGSKSEAFFVEAGVDLGEFTSVPVTIFANID